MLEYFALLIMPMYKSMQTPLSAYKADLSKPEFQEDPAQLLAVENLQRLFDELLQKPEAQSLLSNNWLSSLFSRDESITPIKGLYFWGGVGRGKTYLMDTFYHCLPFAEKKRTHFHVFMQQVHELLKQYRDRKDPLQYVAKDLVSGVRILCFDEFVVTDVADAVILAKLLDNIFAMGVSLVATSNVEPKHLYKNGLQRSLFLPAIDLIYQHTEVLNIDGGIDYRLQFLNKADIYFTPLNEAASVGLRHNFTNLAPEVGKPNHVIEVLGRSLQTVHWADGIVWFEFAELCETARSQNDYIELARCFHSLVLGNVPVLTKFNDDAARRLINLIDILYEHNVKLIMSAACEIDVLYQGKKEQIKFEFDRTMSRLHEMQSTEYLALPHLT